jgi:hypothetical protein
MNNTISYADSLNSKVEREYEKCFSCNKSCPKSWIIINNDGILKDTETVKYPSELHYCSTNCYNSDKQTILPTDAWSHLKNKQDFSEPHPVLPEKKKEFVYLSFMEIRNLSNEEREKYHDQLEDFMTYNLHSTIYLDQYYEDQRTFEIENDFENYSDDYDYYDNEQ